MKRGDILAAFRHFGLDEVVAEDVNPHGPTVTFAARRAKKSER